MRILVDIDGVVADLVGALCSVLRVHGFDRYPKDITTYHFQDTLSPDEQGVVDAAMRSPGFVASMPWYPGAPAFLGSLQKCGEVVGVTRPYEHSRTWVHEREQWLQGYLDKTVHTAHKELVAGDFLIEDSTDNAVKWAAAHPRGTAYLLARPWVRAVSAPNIEWVPDYAAILRRIHMRGAV